MLSPTFEIVRFEFCIFIDPKVLGGCIENVLEANKTNFALDGNN